MIDDLYSKRIHTTLRNIPSPRQDLTFAQLKIYYQERGLELNEKFANSLELFTPDGKFNYIAYLLADENGVSIKVAKYAGTDKVDLIENEEYGYCSLIKATNQVMEKLKIENSTMAKVSEHFIKVEFPFSVPKDTKNIASGNENGNENDNEKNEEQKALEILRAQPEITAKEMASRMGVSARTIGRIMKRLRDKEIITRVGSDRKGYWEIHEK